MILVRLIFHSLQLEESKVIIIVTKLLLFSGVMVLYVSFIVSFVGHRCFNE